MAINFGKLAGSVAHTIAPVTNLLPGGDITPGFNINSSPGGGIPFISKGNGSTGQAPASSSLLFPNSGVGAQGGTGSDSGAYQNSGYYGGGGGGASGGGQSAADLAYYDSLQNDAQGQLSRLDTQLGIGQQNINGSYQSSLNQLLGQKATTDRNYNASKDQTKQDYVQGRGNIQAQVGQQNNALQKLLGSHGYSGSGNIAASYGAAREGSIQNANIGQTFGRNQQALDTNYGDYLNQFEASRGGLDSQKKNQENQLLSQSQQTRQGLLGQLSQIAQARTGSAAAGQGYRDQVNQLGGQIDQLGAQYQNPAFNVQQATYKAPDLAAYDVAPKSTPQLETAPGAGDNLNPFLNVLLNQQDKRKQNNLGVA